MRWFYILCFASICFCIKAESSDRDINLGYPTDSYRSVMNTGIFFGMEAGYQSFYRLPSFAYGQNLTSPATPFSPLTLSDDSAENYYVGGNVGVFLPSKCIPYWLGEETWINLSCRFFEDEKSNSFAFNSPSAFFIFITGFPFQIFPEGAGKFSRRYDFYGADLDLNTKYFLNFQRFPISISPFVRFGVHQFEQRYNIRIERFALSIFVLTLNEILKTTYYDIGSGLRLAVCPFSKLSLFVEGGFYGSYADTLFVGDESVSTSAGDFNVGNVRDLHHGWNTKVKAKAGISSNVFGWLLEVVGDYEFWGYVPVIVNPTALLTTVRVLNSFTAFYSVGFKASHMF